MLNLKLILKNKEEIKNNLSLKNFDLKKVDDVYELGIKRSKVMEELQKLEARRNNISKEIGILKSQKKEIVKELKEVSKIKHDIEKIKNNEIEINEKINELLLDIPNILSKDVPKGKDESQNKIMKEYKIGRGKVKPLKSHYDIGVKKGIVDFDRAVKMSGSRFWSYTGNGALLVRALQNFMLDTHIKNGYKELSVPVIVNEKSLIGTGQLPKFKEDLFKLDSKKMYLIPTGEVPLTNFYSNEIVNLSAPIKLTALTQCFRSEAGSGGRDMKGLIRAHQFSKVELVKIVKIEDEEKEFKKLIDDAKNILIELELPFQELALCTGDHGFTQKRTIDLEIWLPSENRYRECSSISTFGDFQSRRAMIRYKDENNKNQYAVTMNGSAIAIDRVVASILEVYQNDDGSIDIPKVLQKYMNGVKKI